MPASPSWSRFPGSTTDPRAILEQLDDGRLGDLTFSRIRLSHDGAIAGWLPERFYDPATAVGGALSDLGCHPVYLTQLFLGTIPDTVSATYSFATKRQVEDQAVVTLGYPDGAIGVVETGFLSNDPFTIELQGIGQLGVRERRKHAQDPWRWTGQPAAAVGTSGRPRPVQPVGHSHPRRHQSR